MHVEKTAVFRLLRVATVRSLVTKPSVVNSIHHRNLPTDEIWVFLLSESNIKICTSEFPQRYFWHTSTCQTSTSNMQMIFAQKSERRSLSS